jgi:signal transduction histidine kinase/CheY-like chemotaxis protein/HAMP domain-containing protein
MTFNVRSIKKYIDKIMNIKNIKIGTQLKFGFAALLFFVIVLGVISYQQTYEIHLQTETMYDHPLKVRRAIGSLEIDILSMRLSTRDLMLAKSEQEKQSALHLMEISAADAQKQFNILYDQYLGPRSDIDEAHNSFINWKTARDVNTKLSLTGEIEKVKESVSSKGTVGIYREKLLAGIKKIDDFARNKGDELITASDKLVESLQNQLFILVAVIFLFSLIIMFSLLRNIRMPLEELKDATQRFHNGDMNARSSYQSKNEFGELSASYNALAANIQMNMDLDDKSTSIIQLMLSEEDAKRFFQITLNQLASYTDSQISSVYLLSDDKKTYEHFESIGLSENSRKSFNAVNFEGEFGLVLSSQKIQHIKNISEDTRFTFQTVSGKFFPREIITIPIISGKEVIAIISLASLSNYEKHSILLIEYILDTLCARIEGILAYRKMKEFSEKLEFQNRELETQKAEMSAQSAELTEQNTELEMQKKQLDEANRLKTNFLSNMSHELRTPLNSVIALSGVLNRRLAHKIPEEEYSYIDVIERNGKHLLSLINDILDISRIEAGKEDIEITNFNMNNLVAEVVSMIEPQAKQKNIELLHSNKDTIFSISNDATKCRHIIQNLIANAVKFTEKGKVEIISKLSGQNIEITVSDTGIGISENHLSHIFDEFRQADGSTSRRFGGTGLGLAIAKKYANLLGGTISVKSTPGIGSEFTLTLPLRYDSDNRIIESEPTSDFKKIIKSIPNNTSAGTSLKTILLVEDSEPAIIQIKDIFEENGYQILVARDGAEALEILSHTIPDAMILDLMMPGVNGFDVLKSLREFERTSHIPVLILTAKHITKDELKFLKSNNVHQLIQKGDVNRRELLIAIETMVSPEIVETIVPQREIQNIVGKPIVLIVEDNPDNMLTIKAILDGNYTLIESVDGNEGVLMAAQYKPNLILMDIALPGLDGIEAFKMIRKNEQLKHIPVIAITASAMTSDRETILSHGFEAYISKPIDDKLFINTVNEILYGK